MARHYNIIIPADMNPRPRIHEETAAAILAKHFSCDVYFLKPTNRNTPDVSIMGVEWELKGPVGSSQNSIQKNLREASKQSSRIVIDLRRSKLHQTKALAHINYFCERYRRIHQLLVITKVGRVLTIKG